MFAVDSATITNNTDLTAIFGAEYGAVKWSLATLTLGILLLGVVGNVIVLVGSIKYKALKMDKVSVLLLESIAVADLVLVIAFCVPMLSTLAAERWVLGETLCIMLFFKTGVNFTEITLITWMSCYRMKIVLNPLAEHLSHRRAVIAVVMIWLFWFGVTGLDIGIDPDTKFIYVPSGLECWYGDPLDLANLSVIQKYYSYFWGCIFGIPIPVITVCNLVILYKVGKSSALRGGSALPGIKALKTVTYICAVFMISYAPGQVYFFLNGAKVKMPEWFTLLCKYPIFINMFSNPIIYAFTNPSFAKFLRQVYRTEEETAHAMVSSKSNASNCVTLTTRTSPETVASAVTSHFSEAVTTQFSEAVTPQFSEAVTPQVSQNL